MRNILCCVCGLFLFSESMSMQDLVQDQVNATGKQYKTVTSEENSLNTDDFQKFCARHSIKYEELLNKNFF